MPPYSKALPHTLGGQLLRVSYFFLFKNGTKHGITFGGLGFFFFPHICKVHVTQGGEGCVNRAIERHGTPRNEPETTVQMWSGMTVVGGYGIVLWGECGSGGCTV